MTLLPSIFETCQPRGEILAGVLPDALFAADLWDVVGNKAHQDYLDPARFFAGTHPTANLRLLLKDVAERLDGAEGGTSTFQLETGFGGGKTHSLIATVHVAREGKRLAAILNEYGINRLPGPGQTRIAAFVGENSDPYSGTEHEVAGQRIRTFTPWGQIALMAGGLAGYARVKGNDLDGVVPGRDALEEALGDGPVLILLDEFVLFMARCLALPEGHPRKHLASQWPTFFQTILSLAAHRPQTVLILTLPSEQDANRSLTGELKGVLPAVLDIVGEVEKTAARQARNLTPTQATERAAVLARRLFERVDFAQAAAVADAFVDYYQEQQLAGAGIPSRALQGGYRDLLRTGYPFHPELIRLFAERLADIPEFQTTRGALRLVARIIRSTWQRRQQLKDALLLQVQHIDLTQGDLRDEILARLGRTAFERGLDVDVANPAGGTHAAEIEAGWPWQAASEAALVAFLHSLPDGSRGVTAPEAALAVGRPGVDLAYVPRGLQDTERKAWYLRSEGEHFLFRVRASINKRYQEHLSRLQAEPGAVKQTLDDWVQKLYSGFANLQIILFPLDQSSIADTPERLRLAVIHYDTECAQVGGGDRLNFTKKLFTATGVHESPRGYRNNLLFLLAEPTRVAGIKDASRALIAWENVSRDIETEQANLAQTQGMDYQSLKRQAERGAAGVPAEFLALDNDLAQVRQKIGEQEVHLRSRILEAYRVLAMPRGGRDDEPTLFRTTAAGTLLECFRVDFGEQPEEQTRRWRSIRQPVAEGPILQCLRQNQKLVAEATPDHPLVLAPALLRRPPLWRQGETKVSTAEVWDRIRREPEAPMVLKPTDLLPTFREGLATQPEPLWMYYNQAEKKVWNQDNGAGMTPVIASNHFLHDPKAAVLERIVPVATIAPQEVWDHLWPKDGATRLPSTPAPVFLVKAGASPHFPVMPDRGVLWQALREGVRENRWILYLRGPRLAIGVQEMHEWPSTARFDDDVELWDYQAALDSAIYPRAARGDANPNPLTPDNLKKHCWPGDRDRLSTEELERHARAVWADATRSLLEEHIRAGLQAGLWEAWKQGPDETYYTKEDTPHPTVRVDALWTLADPGSELARNLVPLRPGKGPQPVEHLGTPRQVLTRLWEELSVFKEVRLAELILDVDQREGFDNTLRATWADRPKNAKVHASVNAGGQRTDKDGDEAVQLAYEGRFEEVSTMLAPIWPFQRGELDVTITLRVTFEPPVPLTDPALETYRTAIMNANQGTLHGKVVPARQRGRGTP